jgi:hypothetical protein
MKILWLLLLSVTCYVEFARGTAPEAAEVSSAHAPFPSSSSKAPFLGLTVAGKLKCLLWRSPISSSSTELPLTPLFSSPNSSYSDGRPLIAKPSIFATAKYHFLKDRWYGLQAIGMLLHWNLSRQCNIERKRNLFPTAVIVAAERCIPLSCRPIDSASLRLGWGLGGQEVDEASSKSEEDGMTPWIQVGIDCLENRDQSPRASFGLFFPLCQQLDLQWTSYIDWCTSFTGSQQEHFENQKFKIQTTPLLSSQKPQNRDRNEMWWMPQISLDPLGSLSSLNRYRNVIWNDQYMVDVKLRLSTKVSFSSGNIMDDDPRVSLLRLDCSVMGLGRRPKHVTTARVETVVAPSAWWGSIKETSKLSLIHEHRTGGNR